MTRVAWEVAGGTHVGRVRRGNEDAFHVDAERGLFLVADGMGGHAAGEVASAVAVETVGGALRERMASGAAAAELDGVLADSFRAAHGAILAYTAANPQAAGMGTTLTACVLSPGGDLRVGHIGDSRAYLLRGGVLTQLTVDHTWVQREVEAGRLSPRRARGHPLGHVLTRALGADSADDADVYAFALEPGDVLCLATDGLTGMVPDERLASILGADRPLADVVKRLIGAANRAGGRDNVTAVVVRVSAAVEVAQG